MTYSHLIISFALDNIDSQEDSEHTRQINEEAEILD